MSIGYHTEYDFSYAEGYEKGYEKGKKDAQTVRHGHWIWLEPYGSLFTHRRKCSECGDIKAQEESNFCPNCGAKNATYIEKPIGYEIPMNVDLFRV